MVKTTQAIDPNAVALPSPASGRGSQSEIALDRAEHDRDAANVGRDAANVGRDAANVERNVAERGRDLAVAERDAAHLARTEAEAATAAREELMAIIAHDLKNPLNAVSLALTLALHELPADAPVRKRLAVIDRGARRIEQLLRDLVDFTSVKGGRLSLDVRPFAARTLVDLAIEACEADAATKGVVLTSTIGAVGTLLVDGGRLQQLLVNLLSNAVKFTNMGGLIGIEAVPVEASRRVRFTVRDTGRGILPHHLANLFDRYWQAPQSPSAAHEGRGLGLYIAKGIAEAHGGRLEVESVVGKGTAFSFTVPRSD
jgi:signal transduction histidine kinase